MRSSRLTGVQPVLGLLFFLVDLLDCAAQVNALELGSLLGDLPFDVLQIQLGMT